MAIRELVIPERNLEDFYSCPQNIFDIQVCNPITHKDEKEPFTDYEISCHTNLPMFKKQTSVVRRRYSEFVWLHNVLIRENPSVRIPELPPRRFFAKKFDEATIEERRNGFQKFLRLYKKEAYQENGMQ